MNSDALVNSVKDVLEQGLLLLETAGPDQYQVVAPAPHSASIGQHYRHVLDHFICLADGIVNRTIDYDSRTRDRRLELDRDAAKQSTQDLLNLFASLSQRELSSPYKVLYSVGYSEGEAQLIDTVLAREIAFCVSHAIHHFAIIRLVCSHFDLSLPVEFGVAPSTLKHRAAQVGA